MLQNILYELYVTQGKSFKTIAKEQNTTCARVQYWIKKYGIPTRSNKKLKDLTGQVFGQLTVLKLKKSGRNVCIWTCQCRCGNIKDIARSSLVTGLTNSCGCLQRSQNRSRRTDINSIKLENCQILHEVKSKRNLRHVKCKCKCGKEFIRRVYLLKRNPYSSCGCSNVLTQSKNRKFSKYSAFEDINSQYWKSVLNGAILRNLEFDITAEDVWKQYIKQNRKCSLSGLDIHFQKENFHRLRYLQTASLDRINSSKGYTIDNIQIVHKDVNIMKQNFSEEYFINICFNIYKYNIKAIN